MHKRLLGILAIVAIVVAACGGATSQLRAVRRRGAAVERRRPRRGPTGEQTLTYPIDGTSQVD